MGQVRRARASRFALLGGACFTWIVGACGGAEPDTAAASRLPDGGVHLDAAVADGGDVEATDGAVDASDTDASSDTSPDGSTVDAGGRPVDPTPAEIDLSNLIPGSGSHVLLMSFESGQAFAGHILGLDLQNGAVHDLMPGGGGTAYLELSPDGRTVLFSGANAAVLGNLAFVRALDEGLVPMTVVSGLEDRADNHYLRAFSADGRFAFYERGRTAGVEVVDIWRGRLHWYVDADPGASYASMTAAPRGYWFAYHLNEEPLRGGVARITDDGAEVFEISGYRGGAGFSRDGTRVMYAAGDGGVSPPPYYVRDLEDGDTIPLNPPPVSNASFQFGFEFSIDREHVIGAFKDAEDTYLARRVSIASGESTELEEPGHDDTVFWSFHDEREVLIVYSDGAEYTVAVADPTGAHPQEKLQSFPMGNPINARFGRAGAKHGYYMADGLGLTLVARDEAGMLQRATVTDPGELGFLCDLDRYLPPAERLAFYVGGGSAVVLVDLAQPRARRVTTLLPQNGGSLGCPVWNAAGTALAVAETRSDGDSTHSYIQLVRWPEDAEPRPPESVYEADGSLEVLLARP